MIVRMGRQRVHQPEAILDAARALVLEAGAGAATVGAIAGASGAPIGSIYHVFGSRDALLARLWIRAVERSQMRFLAALEHYTDPRDGAVAAALSIYDFARDEPGDARLLVSLRREDLMQMPLPPDVAAELTELNRPVQDAIGALAHRLYGRAARKQVDQTALAVFDLPYGALRRHLVSGHRPPTALRDPLARAVRAAIEDKENRHAQRPA
jgi:AcrR family transcriptional regulator